MRGRLLAFIDACTPANDDRHTGDQLQIISSITKCIVVITDLHFSYSQSTTRGPSSIQLVFVGSTEGAFIEEIRKEGGREGGSEFHVSYAKPFITLYQRDTLIRRSCRK